jgi:hypothetical protein
MICILGFTDFQVSAVQASYRKGTVSPEDLARRWFIGIETAKLTIENTMQRGVRDFNSTQGSRRLKHTNYQLKYRHLRSAVYTDTLMQRSSHYVRILVGKSIARISSGKSFIQYRQRQNLI